jgi:hypothetical protein
MMFDLFEEEDIGMVEFLELTRAHSTLLWKMMIQLERGFRDKGVRGAAFDFGGGWWAGQLHNNKDEARRQPAFCAATGRVHEAEFENWL